MLFICFIFRLATWTLKETVVLASLETLMVDSLSLMAGKSLSGSVTSSRAAAMRKANRIMDVSRFIMILVQFYVIFWKFLLIAVGSWWRELNKCTPV